MHSFSPKRPRNLAQQSPAQAHPTAKRTGTPTKSKNHGIASPMFTPARRTTSPTVDQSEAEARQAEEEEEYVDEPTPRPLDRDRKSGHRATKSHPNINLQPPTPNLQTSTFSKQARNLHQELDSEQQQQQAHSNTKTRSRTQTDGPFNVGMANVHKTTPGPSILGGTPLRRTPASVPRTVSFNMDVDERSADPSLEPSSAGYAQDGFGLGLGHKQDDQGQGQVYGAGYGQGYANGFAQAQGQGHGQGLGLGVPKPLPKGTPMKRHPGLSGHASVHLPDMTGLTSAVDSPARLVREYKRYQDVSEMGIEDARAVEARLVTALNTVQSTLAQIETENSHSRRRVRELEMELDACKADVARERTRVLEREKEERERVDRERAAEAGERRRRAAQDKEKERNERSGMVQEEEGVRYKQAVEEKKGKTI
jgi:hypothetical protein